MNVTLLWTRGPGTVSLARLVYVITTLDSSSSFLWRGQREINGSKENISAACSAKVPAHLAASAGWGVPPEGFICFSSTLF